MIQNGYQLVLRNGGRNSFLTGLGLTVRNVDNSVTMNRLIQLPGSAIDSIKSLDLKDKNFRKRDEFLLQKYFSCLVAKPTGIRRNGLRLDILIDRALDRFR